jgi:two-component system response regulator HydG
VARVGLAVRLGMASRRSGGSVYAEGLTLGTLGAAGRVDRALRAEHDTAMPSAAKRDRAGRVLVVDDDPDILAVIERALGADAFEVRAFPSAAAVLEELRATQGGADVVLADIHMSGMDGLELVAAVRGEWPAVVAILMTGEADVSTAVQGMRLGVYDYLVKPIDVGATLLPVVRRAVEYRRLRDRNRYLERQLDVSERFEGMVGSSPTMRRVHELVASVAPTQATVLVLGESGTGKELVARAIHQQSTRSGKAFVDVNCAALTETILESELFGHVRGAFTGAIAPRRGLFEEASGGTLFLDEIGELSPSTQVRLLRVLQEGRIRPVGSNESRVVDVRVVAATNRDLGQAVRQQRFRADLYYRLDVMTIELPPLRERMEDVVPLTHHFLAKQGAKLGKPGMQIADEALARLTAYLWPGNIRELENAIERAIILARTDTITADVLPTPVREGASRAAGGGQSAWLPLADARTIFERQYVQQALEQAGGSLTEAARLSGLDRSNFRRLVKRLRLVGS